MSPSGPEGHIATPEAVHARARELRVWPYSVAPEMNRMFDDFFQDFGVPGRLSSAWPRIEVSEAEDEIKVLAELPGLEEKDVEAVLDEGVLTLKGEKKVERNGTLYSERYEGSFERTIPVGQDVDPDKVKASFRNGVLTVRMPKKPEAKRQARRIAIQ